MNVQTDRFPEYFVAVHGCEPFPWQRRLLEQVVEAGNWPGVLSLPTGAGKTAVLDVAVFALACGAKTPRRTALVVDRRIVVDDAYHRAERIRAALDAGRDGVLEDVRRALLARGGAAPIRAALLRGGIYREDNWARDPLQPVLICSTVDQVGSRLLHQGYGVSPHTRSIHAGLLANDCLIVLDEAHVSEPFRQTLEWVGKFRRVAERPLDAPFAVMTMTATPRAADTPFTLNDNDRADPVLHRRLTAKKRLRMVKAEKAKDAGLVAQLVAETVRCLHPGRTILVVANRVMTALSVAKDLDKRRGALNIEKPILLTGRSRPLERDRLLSAHRDEQANRLFSGRDRNAHASAPALVVVATQCVEVGADIDADTLVTEVCSLDALRQRLGRLDRLGEVGETECVLVASAEVEDAGWEDPVYGASPRALWGWLREKEQDKGQDLNVGIDGWDALLKGIAPETLGALVPAPPNAPVMFPAYLDLWVQTSPEPAVVPDPAIFLHGLRRGAPEVQIVWRADLPADRLDTWADIVAECPPVTGEALTVPLHQARTWLEGDRKTANKGGDMENGSGDEATPRRGELPMAFTPFLRWQGRETPPPSRNVADLKPGDTVVVPCGVGGCDGWGWAPEHTARVVDLADEARWKGDRNPILRLHSSLPIAVGDAFAGVSLEQTEDVLAEIEDWIAGRLRELNPADIEEAYLRAMVTALKRDVSGKRKALDVLPHPSGEGWIVRGRHRMAPGRSDLAIEDDTASRLACAVTLREHTEDVGAEVGVLADRLAAAYKAELSLAARFHDFGKADPRFQAMLQGGNRFLMPAGEPLAKSPKMAYSARDAADAYRRAGYPAGARHELLSVRLAEAALTGCSTDGCDVDLVLHLIASHHGRCRSFAPYVEDPSPRMVTVQWEGRTLTASSDTVVDGVGLEHLASGVPERFWRLVRRYGWWGLSFLEACLRLADWRASEREDAVGVSNGGEA